LFAAIINAVSHRGDQPSAACKAGGAWLGCARLAIVDRPLSIQPISIGDWTLAYNGEIYNHNALRNQLIEVGVTFHTDGDTEVLLQSFLTWGESFVTKIEGMYAAILYNSITGDSIAIRDPYGIKPLYKGSIGRQVAYCSEIKGLTGAGARDIKPVSAGSILYNGSRLPLDYTVHLDPLASSAMPFDQAKTELKNALANAVLRHLPPDDLPLAVFCSGGIDSSIVLYEAVEAARRLNFDPAQKIRAYSIGTADSEDPKYAARLAKLLNVPFHFEHIDINEMVASIPETVRVIESFEPNHIRAGTTSLALSRRVAADGFKVALLGEGADELFGGYEEFPAARRNGSITEVEDLLRIFQRQLHRTQLRRVDRTSMAFGVEARVPFLDARVAELVRKIPTSYKVHLDEKGVVTGKHILREAYRGLLPDEIVDRRKVPMGEGAGVGDNRPAGAFYEEGLRRIPSVELAKIQVAFPSFNIKTQEEAYYFSIFKQIFGALPLAADRPRTNALPTT
jgi:asparagine synthase (glutamine-hydrolysing)